ncbi:MAG: glycosyltransferase family 39 protein [Dehalococcoidia bacterium]
MAERSVAVSSPPSAASGRLSDQLSRLRISPVALWLGGITLIGLAMRLFWVLYVDTIPLGGDPHWYYIVAANVAKGYGYVSNSGSAFLSEQVGSGKPTAFWPPAYSFILGACYKMFGINAPSNGAITFAKVLNAVLSAATIPFVYALGGRIFDKRVGLLAAGLFAVFPNPIAWTPVLFPEPLFVLLFVAALWVLVAFPLGSRRDWLPLVVFGALVAVATLTRGQGGVLVPVAVIYWLGRDGWRATLRPTAISLVAAVALIAPWTVRNYVEMDAFIPISTNSGAALRVGHNAESTGTTRWTDDDVGGFRMEESAFRPDWEVRGYREYTRLAIDYAFTHPANEVRLTGLKLYHLYSSDAVVIPWLTTLDSTPFEPASAENVVRWVLDVSYYLMLFAALAYVPLWLRRSPERVLLVSVFVIWTLFHIVFLAEPRYHVPLYPIFAISVAAGFFEALKLVGRSSPDVDVSNDTAQA